MHVCPLFVFDPSPFATVDEVDASMHGFLSLAAAIDERQVPAAIHISARLMKALVENHIEPELPSVEWVRTGWAGPDLASLPDRLVGIALGSEAEAMRHLGLEPGSLWLRGSWDRRIPHVVSGAGIDCLLVHADVLGDGQPGVVAFLDSILPVIPVLGHMPDPSTGDGLALFLASGTDHRSVLEEVSKTSHGRILTPGAYLKGHQPRGRFSPPAESAIEDRESGRLRRKMIRLATRLPDKLPARAAEALLDGCHAPSHVRGADITLLRGAHEALVRARAAIDADRHRGDDWTRVSRVDWDADGDAELQIELASMSVVIDPERGGEILVFDDKARTWVVNLLDAHTGGAICRFETRDGEQIESALTVQTIEETKGAVSASMNGRIGDGVLTCRVAISAGKLVTGFDVERVPPGRIGLEMAVALGESKTRVDGSEWAPVAGDVQLTGHRFRFAGTSHQILITSITPAECFVTASPGGITVWINWVVEGSASHEVSVDLNA